MCVNMAFENLTINNVGQKLAGTGIFASRAKKCSAVHDSPLELNICRLHFEERHKKGSWGELPRGFSIAVPNTDYARMDDEDAIAYRLAIMADTAIGRGYWKSIKKETFYFPAFLSKPGHQHGPESPCQSKECLQNEIDFELAIESCTKGRWAFVSAQLSDSRWQKVEKGEAISLGEWHKDGYGCHLSCAIPVGMPVELVGEGYSAGPSGFMYQVGSLGVKIPWGTKWALWIRCSDTGAHSGFTVIGLRWDERNNQVFWYPVLASLFSAPHDFPCEGYFFGPTPVQYETGATLNDALGLAATIAANGGFLKTPPKLVESYDAIAHAHSRGQLGVFGV